MRALAFNCSPKMEKGNTALILGRFLDGMKEAGAEVELSYTRRLKINPCQGELNCWLKTPGRCFQNDDMAMFLPRMGEAHICRESELRRIYKSEWFWRALVSYGLLIVSWQE